MELQYKLIYERKKNELMHFANQSDGYKMSMCHISFVINFHKT